jgi:hypothetical protein
MSKNIWKIVSVLLVLFFGLSACYGSATTSDAQKAAEEKASQANVYVLRNNLELNNYNRRMQIADDPTTILWCTTAYPFTGSPMFTVAVVGKLTSGNKRPYQTEIIKDLDLNVSYYPELPGPDGMFGSSGEYRYGFSPAGQYYDFYNMPTFCTTEPMIWQREQTTIVMGTDPTLLAAQQLARELLAQGKTVEAQKVLTDAIQNAGGK